MNFINLNTYNQSHERAFEALCNQLFERWVRKEYATQLKHFSTIRGDGGDGGVEAYAILLNGDVIGVQSKWFPLNIAASQVNQIRSSIKTAIKVRPNLKKYIICLPKDFASLTARNKNKSNTEEARLKALKDEIIDEHSDLKLIFWDEHAIRIQLQKAGNEGIRRFWFEKSELSQESLNRKFEIEKAGWLNERYVPRLHLVGIAEQKIKKALFTPEARLEYINSIEDDLTQMNLAISLIDKFNRRTSGYPINKTLFAIKENLKAFKSIFLSIKDDIKSGNQILKPNKLEEVYLWDAKLKLERKNYGNPNKNLQYKLSEVLDNLHGANLSHWISDTPKYIAPHNLILMGEPGTGKTHTLAYVVEKRLEQKLPAIIIQAKTSPCESWEAIFRHALGGLSSWSFEEISSALEALAIRADAYRVLEKKVDVLPIEPTAVLITIDGLDEIPLKHYAKWRIRINELKAIAKQFNRLRFILSCRHYGVQSYNPLELDFDDEINRRFDLSDGLPKHHNLFYHGSKVEELVISYFNEYDIKYEGLHWLKGAFKTPLELKLFCENYQGQDITDIVQPINTTLKFLLSEKVFLIEKEFTEYFSPTWAKSEQVFKKALMIIAKVFMEYNNVTHDSLCQEIQNRLNGVIDRVWAGKILEFIAKHGILLQIRKIDENDFMEIETITYETTYQSYTDYLIALKAALDIGKNKKKTLPNYLFKENLNILNLTAMSLLNDYGILIGEKGYWIDDFDEFKLHFMQYQALGQGSTAQIECRLPILEERFKTSRPDRASILQFLVLPHTNSNLVLEKNFVHKILSSYSNSFERDLIWSGNEYFSNNSDEIPSPSSILLRIHPLEKWHTHEERPLLFAWGLTCLDNHARKRFRKALTIWGARNVQEFVKLLNLVFFCNAPQVQEDLATIALGIASLVRTSGQGLNTLAKWMLKNVFDRQNNSHIFNSVIRYGARAVVERAFQLKELTLKEVEKARPPYIASPNLLPLDLSVLTIQGSYPIGNDLEWYVIEKSYDGFLDYGVSNEAETRISKFLSPYYSKYAEKLSPDEWAKAAAKAYIRSLGFNRTEGTTMTDKTHGQLSQVMTFEEKYVWLAVHEIQGYLADHVPYKDDNDVLVERLLDYSEILNIPNPVSKQMLMTIGEVEEFELSSQISSDGMWFIPEEIAPILKQTENGLKENVLSWVNAPQQPNFAKWINTGQFFTKVITQKTQRGTTLYGYLSLSEPNTIGRTSLHQVCFLIDTAYHTEFINNFQLYYKQLWWYFDGLDAFQADTTSTYVSPDDIVWMDWIGENSSKVKIDLNTNETPFYLINTVVKVVDDDVVEGENFHRLPSKFLRNELGIVNMGYHSFFNNRGQQTAWTMKSGKPFYDSQNFVFVDTEKFERMLIKNNLKPIWGFFQFKGTTAEFKKNHKDAHAQNCKLWMVWEEEGVYKYYLYHDGRFRRKH